jgi:hypothetical protein
MERWKALVGESSDEEKVKEDLDDSKYQSM